ncbi:MAG: hypothetical protein ACYDCL_02370 [Myxococcales bacterium]
MASPGELLDHVQAQLEAIHDLRSPSRARDFLMGRKLLDQLGRPGDAPEELLVVEEPSGLSVGLYLAPELFQALRRVRPDGSSGASLAISLLPAFAAVTEGVSHFLYLFSAAEADRPVSRLELEVQGEVDKFAAAALHLWGRGLARLAGNLCERLFRSVSYLPSLTADERQRYQTANRLAGGYARHLVERFVARGELDGFLAELRRSYRLWSQDKLHHLEACAA